jgi:hypothetical protein
MLLKVTNRLLKNVIYFAKNNVRTLTHYPIDDDMFGLTSDQKIVNKFKFILIRKEY